jgi:N-acetylglutamate synthase-like GNAT family acetyltransferase
VVPLEVFVVVYCIVVASRCRRRGRGDILLQTKNQKKEKETVHNLKQEEEKGYDSPEKKTSNN